MRMRIRNESLLFQRGKESLGKLGQIQIKSSEKRSNSWNLLSISSKVICTREYCEAILFCFLQFCFIFWQKKSTCIFLLKLSRKTEWKCNNRILLSYLCLVNKRASLFCLGFALSSNHVETSRIIKRIEKQMKTPWILSITITDLNGCFSRAIHSL